MHSIVRCLLALLSGTETSPSCLAAINKMDGRQYAVKKIPLDAHSAGDRPRRCCPVLRLGCDLTFVHAGCMPWRPSAPPAVIKHTPCTSAHPTCEPARRPATRPPRRRLRAHHARGHHAVPPAAHQRRAVLPGLPAAVGHAVSGREAPVLRQQCPLPLPPPAPALNPSARFRTPSPAHPHPPPTGLGGGQCAGARGQR